MFSTFKTSLGYMTLATWGGEIVGLSFGHSTLGASQKSLEQFYAQGDSHLLKQAGQDSSSKTALFHEQVEQRLTRYAEGESIDLDDLPISLSGMTEFQKQVVAACRAIPWGETLSYGQLAMIVGRPDAARAVGTVMRKNRYPLIVPCHRVLASGGKLGGYSAPQGLAMKRRLLALEKIALGAANI
jgi:methylated-DNA-[protein]-cysteine S-methyltransferase